MAKQKTGSTTSFFEVVFIGKPKVVRAFLRGLIMGSGQDSTVFYSFHDGIKHDGKATQLAELVGIRATDCHVVVDEGTSKLLKRLDKRIHDETGLEITTHRKVRSAAMEFSFEAFAPRYHEEIMTLLDKLPTGLRLWGFKHEVTRDKDARGVEAYASAHDFESRGQGGVIGSVDKLVAFRRTCADFPLIKVEDIELK